MNPFDLQKALAGEPVVTKQGFEVKICIGDDIGIYPVRGYFRREPSHTWEERGWNTDGTTDRNDDNWDLFMAPVKKKGWVNINKANDNFEGCVMVALEKAVWESEEVAKHRLTQMSNPVPNAITVPIEWEE